LTRRFSKSAEGGGGRKITMLPLENRSCAPRDPRRGARARFPLGVRGFHSCGQGRSGPSGGRRALRAGVGLGGGEDETRRDGRGADTTTGPDAVDRRRDLACRWVRAGAAARGDVSCRDEEAGRPGPYALRSLVWAAIIVGPAGTGGDDDAGWIHLARVTWDGPHSLAQVSHKPTVRVFTASI
jgi:hypothetical protein